MQYGYAESVFHATLNSGDSFDIEGHPFKIGIYEKGIAFISSQEYIFILREERTCEQRDKYNFCYEQLTDRGDTYKLEQRYLIVLKVDTLCENCKPLGTVCVENKDCASSFCVYGVCKSATKFCGDTFCAEGEQCKEDCQQHLFVKKNIPFTSTNIQLEAETIYFISFNTSETLGYCIDSINKCWNISAPIQGKQGLLILSYGKVAYKDNNSIPVEIFNLKAEDRIMMEKSSEEISKALFTFIVPDVRIITPQLYEVFNLLNEISIMTKPKIVTPSITQTELAYFSGERIGILVQGKLGTDNLNQIIHWKKDNSEWKIFEIEGKNNLTNAYSAKDLRTLKQEILVNLSKPQIVNIPQPVEKSTKQIQSEDNSPSFTTIVAVILGIIGLVIFFKKKNNYYFLKFKGNWIVIIVVVFFGFFWYPFFIAGLIYYFMKLEPKKIQLNNLNFQFEVINRKKKDVIREYNERIEQIKIAEMGKKKKDEELKKAQEELDAKEKQLDTKISYITKKLEEANDSYSKKLAEKIKLESEIQSLDKQNALLNKEKIEKDLILAEKKRYKEELKNKYREAVEKAKDEYPGKKLEKELTYLKNEYSSEEEKIDATIANVKKSLTEHSQEQAQNKQKKENLKEETKEIKSEIKKVEKTFEITASVDKKLLNSYISDKKDAKSYDEFKKEYSSNFSNCQTWPDYVKVYTQLFKSNGSLLTHLANLLMEREKTDNYDFTYKQLQKEYSVELSKHSKNLIEDLKEIDAMTGQEFEEYLSKLFSVLGYDVRKTQATRDGGIDIILKKEGKVTLIQAKKYKINGTVGVDAVRDVHSNAEKYKASELVVLTTAMNFSLDARNDARDKNVKLWNRDYFKELLKKAKLTQNGKN